MPFSNAHPSGTVKQIGDYIRSGYLTTNGLTSRKWNLSGSGEHSKNGEITFNLGPNWHDSDGVSNQVQKELWRTTFELFTSYGIKFAETSDFNADIGVGDELYSSIDVLENIESTNSGIIVRAGIGEYYGFYDENPERFLRSVAAALGLGRPGNYRTFTADSVSSYPNNELIFANDSDQISGLSAVSGSLIWSESDFYSNPDYFSFDQSVTPMPADWQALKDSYSEYGYGTPKAFMGNTIYGYGSNISANDSKVFSSLLASLSQKNALTIVDGGGNDIINMYGIARDQKIDLRGSSTDSSNLNASTVGSNEDTYGNLIIAPGVIIENAKGGNGNDRLIGNNVNNVLDGSFGADNMSGAGGNDTYIVDNDKDITTEGVNQGTDVVRSSVSRLLGANLENLVLTGSGSINGTGNNLKNNITGNGGSNILDGKEGVDTMTGLTGNDTYFVDNIQDSIIENANQGIDTVKSSISWVLAQTFENLTLLGNQGISAMGNGTNNILIGNSASNKIIGEGGADTLDGAAGRDNLSGGIGNDIYIVDNTGDTCVEKPNEGVDEVRSTVNWTLGNNFENLTLIGSQNAKAYGNKLNNKLVGNDENNVLDGLVGSDNMEGRLGDDIYFVDNVKDKTIEKANQGTDIVKSSLSWKLADNIEDLELLGLGKLKATGNKLDNSIKGNDGANIIDGKQGVDKMSGMKGDDTYLVDNKDDKVVEKSKQGFDSIETALSFKLPNHVENLTITGSGKVAAEGNKLDNRIIGNKKDNTINGRMGDDTIDGGKGVDILLLSQKSNKLDLSQTSPQQSGEGKMVIINIENVDAGKVTM